MIEFFKHSTLHAVIFLCGCIFIGLIIGTILGFVGKYMLSVIDLRHDINNLKSRVDSLERKINKLLDSRERS